MSAVPPPTQHSLGTLPSIMRAAKEQGESSTMEPKQGAKDNTIWPALSAEEDEWEMVPTNTSAPLSPVVTFDPSVLDNNSNASETNPNIIHHSASSPDLRHLKLADDDESGVVVSKEEEDASSSLASSAVLVCLAIVIIT